MWVLIAAANLKPAIDGCARARKLADDDGRGGSADQAAIKDSLPVAVDAAANPNDIAWKDLSQVRRAASAGTL
jgi:hypothetical protein